MAETGAAGHFASQAEHDWYAAQYWAMRRKHDGYKAPLATSQHILHLLLTVFTGGLWGIVWIVLAARGNRVPGDPLAPMPVWPPPGHE
jgi:hypothetical protein